MHTKGHDSEIILARQGLPISALHVMDEQVFEDSHGRFFADNMNVEIAINPVETLADWHSYTEALLSQCRDYEGGYDLMFKPVVTYDPIYLEHPLARISGCNPDMSAYTMVNNYAPDFEEMDGTRSLGAHVHATLSGGNPFWYARWMDMLTALPLLFHEEASNRRSLYGGAGCLRVKPYGAEYRTLSNVWVGEPDKREFVWEMTEKAVTLSQTTDPDTVDEWWDVPAAIDNHDLVLAQACMDRLYIYGVTVV
jgi:hypothetical protein